MNVLKSLVKGISFSSTQQEENDDSAFLKEQPNHGSHHDTSPDETSEDRRKLWRKVSGLVGKDTTSLLSLPVSLFEPISVLQSMCEPLRYADLIEKACLQEDPIDRLCSIATFCVALFSNYTRTVKPFNPVLGETFEFVHPIQQYKVIAEQVSHHPPIGIAHTISENWTLQQESRIETRFWGNSVDINGVGNNHLILQKRGDHFTWKNPTACCHNIIFGRMWIEHIGCVTIINNATGDVATVHFKKAGWFEGINYNIHGEAHDSAGNLKAVIAGKWNDHVAVTRIENSGEKGAPNVMWKKQPDIEHTNKWKWPRFVHELTAFDEEYESMLPPTDSRLRTDVQALAQFNMKLAAKEKHRIEEKERHKRKERETQGKKWSPQYFKRVPDERFEYRWEYMGNYWEERESRVKDAKTKQNHSGQNKLAAKKEDEIKQESAPTVQDHQSQQLNLQVEQQNPLTESGAETSA
jgi:hypothetical protein